MEPGTKLTADQMRRVVEAIGETNRNIDRLEKRRTFDQYQEAERVTDLTKNQSHLEKLNKMLSTGKMQ